MVLQFGLSPQGKNTCLKALERVKCSKSPWSRVLPQELTGPQMVKKCLAFCWTRTIITAFTTARHLFLYWVRSIQSMPPSNFLKTQFNIILTSSSRSSKCSLTKIQHASLLSPIRATCLSPSHASWFCYPNGILMCADHSAPHYVVFSTPLLPSPSQVQIFSTALYSQTPSAYVPLSMCETKFHTHTKQQVKLQFCISWYIWAAKWKTRNSVLNDIFWLQSELMNHSQTRT